MAAYYPRRVAKFSDLQKAYPGFETYDDFEEDRIESVAITKSRGKGAPKKKRTAAGKWKWRKRKKREKRWDKMWKTRERREEIGKNELLTCGSTQNPRSLARRRGNRDTEYQFPCLAIYPLPRTTCKNTHRRMGFKNKGKRSIGITKKGAFHGVLSGARFHISGDEKARLVQIFYIHRTLRF